MRKYTTEDIGYINAFEKMTKSNVRDYLNDQESLYFVVQTANFGAIIGKNGENIQELSKKFGKRIKVFRHSKDLKEFAKNLIVRPCEQIDVVDEKNKKSLKIRVANKDKAIVIGREGKNLKVIKELMKKEFDVESIQII